MEINRIEIESPRKPATRGTASQHLRTFRRGYLRIKSVKMGVPTAVPVPLFLPVFTVVTNTLRVNGKYIFIEHYFYSRGVQPL